MNSHLGAGGHKHIYADTYIPVTWELFVESRVSIQIRRLCKKISNWLKPEFNLKIFLCVSVLLLFSYCAFDIFYFPETQCTPVVINSDLMYRQQLVGFTDFPTCIAVKIAMYFFWSSFGISQPENSIIYQTRDNWF